MTAKERAALIVERLEQRYPEAICSLQYEKDYELLFATRLAAQCTDARVNEVTKTLYRTYPTLESFAGADITEMEQAVHSCGFYRHKARDIIACAQVLLSEHGGRVPNEMDALLKLPGVGRKTANLILGDLYGKPAVVADTHCIRISNLLGLCDSQDAAKVEACLRELLEPEKSNDFCHRLVLHGRDTCVARRPDCAACCLCQLCPSCAYTVTGGEFAYEKQRDGRRTQDPAIKPKGHEGSRRPG